MIHGLSLASILLGVTTLSWGYFATGWTWMGGGLVVAGLMWIIAIWRNWKWFSWVGMAVFTLAAGVGLILDLPVTWMLIGLLCGLLGWDLDAFKQNLRFVEKEDQQQMVRAHLSRLGVFFGLAIALGAGSLFLRIRFRFEWMVLWVIFGMGGMSILVRWLRKQDR